MKDKDKRATCPVFARIKFRRKCGQRSPGGRILVISTGGVDTGSGEGILHINIGQGRLYIVFALPVFLYHV
jgi:hypothetical protein